MHAPTARSRAIAYLGILCVLGMFLVYGWFSPAVPRSVANLLGGTAVALVFVARNIRERDGIEIRKPAQIRDQIDRLANIEALGALGVGIVSLMSLGLAQTSAPRIDQQIAFCISTAAILLSFFVNVHIDRKYKHLLDNYDRSVGLGMAG